MKQRSILLIGLAIAINSYCQPQLNAPSFPSSVGLFDLFEVTFSLGDTYSNPYDPQIITVYAVFISPTGDNYRVEAFYYEGYTFSFENGFENAHHEITDVGWRIRFTPNSTGNWRFRIYAEDINGMASMPNTGLKHYHFCCNAVANANGFISVANSRYMKRDVVRNRRREQKSFFPIGPNLAWYNSLYNSNGIPDYTRPLGVYYYKNYIDYNVPRN